MNIKDYKLLSKYYSSNKNKFSSLKSVMLIMSIVIVIIFTTITYMNKFTSVLENETTAYLSEVSKQSVNSVKKQVYGDLGIITAISTFIGGEDSLNLDKILPILKIEGNRNNLKRMGIILPDGSTYTSDGYVDHRSTADYFKKSMQGISTVSDTLIDRFDGEKIIVYSTPIYKNNKVIGVVFAANNIDAYKRILSVSIFNGEGFSYISKSNGKHIIESNSKNANPAIYNILESSPNIVFKGKYNIETMRNNMNANESGMIHYSLENEESFMNYAPIGINDWYLMSVVPKDTITSNFNDLTKITIFINISIIVILIFLLTYIIFTQRRSKNFLEYLAFVDKLTNFGNYNQFSLNSKSILNSRKQKYVYVLFDIDNFKYINDVFGFEEGNKILCHIANVLYESLDKDEIFARKTNDYFAVMMKYTNDSALNYRLNNLTKKFITMYDSSTLKYNLVINYGVYKINKTDTSLDAISDRANIALKTIKGGHKSSIAFYNDDLRSDILKSGEIESIMHLALENNEFKVYLQPKYNLTTNEICGAEALVRWLHPTHGLISPLDFIPLFEKNGFIVNLDMYIFCEVCKKIREWMDKGITPVSISVNQSKVNLHNPSFIKNLRLIIAKYSIPSNLIEIEVTESAVFNNVSHLIDVMNQLKSMGFLLSLDDFGSGYSSLNILKDIPVDILKLDKEFFNDSHNPGHSKIVISSVVNMARSLNIKVISEGVETPEQAEFLKDINCDMAQGYLFAKPMPIPEFEDKAFN